MTEIASASQLRTVQRLLWDAVAEQLKEVERDEVKRVVGSSLIDENAALFAEAEALASILENVQLSKGALQSRQLLMDTAQRRMVVSEISLLIDRLRQVATTAPYPGSAAKARDPDSLLPRGGKEKQVYEYLVSAGYAKSGDGRPCTSSSRPTTASSWSRPSTHSSGASGTSSNPSAVVTALQGKLSVFEVDNFKEVVRSALQDEKALLLEDIDYLTSLLDQETDAQQDLVAAMPACSELQEYSHQLSDMVQSEEARVQHEARVRDMFAAAEQQPSKAGRLRSMVSAGRLETAAAVRPVQAPSWEVSCQSSTSSNPPEKQPRQGPAAYTSPGGKEMQPRISANNSIPAMLANVQQDQAGLLPSSTSGDTPRVGVSPLDSAPVAAGRQLSSTGGSPTPGSRARPTSSMRLRALVASTQVQGQQVPESVCTTAGLSSLGPGQLLPAATMTAQHSGIAPARVGACMTRRVPDMLDAQVDALVQGGVAAILAKHGVAVTAKATKATQSQPHGTVPAHA